VTGNTVHGPLSIGNEKKRPTVWKCFWCGGDYVKSGGIEVDCQNSLVEMKIVDPNNMINLLLKDPLKI